MIADIRNSRQIVEDGYAGGLKLLDGIDAPGLAAAVAQLKSPMRRSPRCGPSSTRRCVRRAPSATPP